MSLQRMHVHYEDEYRQETARLIKSRIDLCSALIIFVFSFFILFLSIFTLDFSEAFLRGGGILTGALLMVLNKRIKSLERMKFLSYLLSVITLVLVTAYSYISKNFFVIGIANYLIMLFILSLVFPWTVVDLCVLGVFYIAGFVSVVAVKIYG